MLSGRKLIIATKHEKGKTIAPILEKNLGVKSQVNISLDTDLLVTFAGEIESKSAPLTIARKKPFDNGIKQLRFSFCQCRFFRLPTHNFICSCR